MLPIIFMVGFAVTFFPTLRWLRVRTKDEYSGREVATDIMLAFFVGIFWLVTLSVALITAAGWNFMKLVTGGFRRDKTTK